MPSASNDLRELMNEYFGDPIDDNGPIQYLISKGYKPSRRPLWFWHLPNPEHVITEKEGNCLQFLIDEWDFGGIWNEDNETA